jgi:hypothetical protein
MTVLCDFHTIIGDVGQDVPVAGAGAEVPSDKTSIPAGALLAPTNQDPTKEAGLHF